MGKLLNISMLCALIITMFGACANGASRTLRFHFYVQEYLSGPNRSVFELTSIDGITSNSPTQFGLVRIADDLITATPNPNSRPVGRLQGLVTFSDFHNIAPKMDLQIIFTAGFYKGSVLIVSGKNFPTLDVNEFAIVGGSGNFTTARGKVRSSIWTTDIHAGRIVLEYFVTVVVDPIKVSSEVSDM